MIGDTVGGWGAPAAWGAPVEQGEGAAVLPRLQQAVERGTFFLGQQQRSGDHWTGILSSSALATGMSLVALQLADAERYGEQIRRGRRWLLQTQAPDGGWGDAVVDPTNINATSLALAALAFTATSDPLVFDGEVLRRARARLEQFGGFAAVGDPERCTLSGPCRTVAALAGLMDWRRIKRLRPEAILLPTRLRRTISTTFPAYLSISLLHASKAPHPLNLAPSYGAARRAALAWLRDAQGPNGSFEESAFLTSVIIMGMLASGQRTLPWLPDAIRFIAESQRSDGGWPIDRDLETFDTDMTVMALREAGMVIPHGDRVRDWLIARQFDTPCFATGAPPGGWAWAMPAGWPDSDDTAYTLLALRELGVSATSPVIRRGAQWLQGMQNAQGAWPTFVRDSKMPFDHDCPYITGHALSALQATGWLDEHPATLQRALAYLAKAQRYDGSFASIWFREATAGTASVLEALADCAQLDSPVAIRAREALLRLQNDDGGWAGMRLQTSTAEETAWAVLALVRCPMDATVAQAVGRGVEWLLAHQLLDGTWVQSPIGLYYSAMWYSDSYYAVTLPTQALARVKALYTDEYAE